jgi:hypothetical protein
MSKKNSTLIVGTYLNKHHVLKKAKGFYRVKLRVYSVLENKTKLYSIKNILVSLEQWDLINSGKKLNEYNFQILNNINKTIDEARFFLSRNDVITLNDFDTIWLNNDPLKVNVFDSLKVKQAQVYLESGISYSNDFKYISSHLKDFCIKLDKDEELRNINIPSIFRRNLKKNLGFHDITPSFLVHFESFCDSTPNSKLYKNIKRKKALSLGSSSKYLRALRVCFNDMIYIKKLLNPSCYPFSKMNNDGAYRIRISHILKSKSLNDSDLRNLISFDTKINYLKRAHDFWVFSFYSKGMNMNDIARVKWSDIMQGDKEKYFSFYRGIKKSENQIQIQVTITNLMWFIINRNKGKGKYLFNIIRKDNSTKQEIEIYKSIESRSCNKNLKIIQKQLNIFQNEQLIMKTARHTAVMTALSGGMSPIDIGKHLGNIDNRSIYAYANSLIKVDNDSEDTMQQLLLDKTNKIVKDKNGNLVIVDN